MHKMEKTPRIITIIGMVVEGISVVVLFGTSILLKNLSNLPGLRNAQEADMHPAEYIDLVNFMNTLGIVVLIMAIVYAIMFFINIVLFSGLIKGRYDEEKAKKIYLYQAIWGGFNLLSNQLTGILYLVSGVQGYNGRKDMINVREGL